MNKLLLLFCVGLQLFTQAQHLKKINDPYTHQTRVMSGKVQLKGSLYLSFRSIDSLVFLTLDGWGKSAGIVNVHDIMLMIISKDTIVVRPTGTQDYHETGHGHYTQEYEMNFDDLIKLSQAPLIAVRRYYANGIEEIPIPANNREKLMQLTKELIAELK